MAAYLIVGASRGIGGETAQYLASRGAELYSVCRTPAVAGKWIEADIGTDTGVGYVCERIGDRTLDGLLFLGGSWEDGAFTDAYDFMSSPTAEVRDVISVNLVAPIVLARLLTPNLAKAENPRIILNGAVSGLPNCATREVTNTAVRFGIQGVAQSLNLSLKNSGIGVTVVNPEYVATQEVLADFAGGASNAPPPIPMADVFATYEYVLSCSARALPAEITLKQKI